MTSSSVKHQSYVLQMIYACNFMYNFAQGHGEHIQALIDFLVNNVTMLQGKGYTLKEFQQDDPPFQALTMHLLM